MLATLVDKPFDAEGWLYGIQWDGYRALAYLLIEGEVEIRHATINHSMKSFTRYMML